MDFLKDLKNEQEFIEKLIDFEKQSNSNEIHNNDLKSAVNSYVTHASKLYINYVNKNDNVKNQALFD